MRTPKDFKYDVRLLLKTIRKHPCIWDKKNAMYRDRSQRKLAWQEICQTLDKHFEDMIEEEQKRIEAHVLAKWVNVRDTFIKTLKPMNGKPKRKYVLHDELSFLTDPDKTYDDYDDTEIEYVDRRRSCSSASSNAFTTETKTKVFDEDSPEKYNSQEISFVECSNQTQTRVMNEDEAFFASLLPTVVAYSLEERLDFRLQVLGVMKKIQENRKRFQ